MSNNENFKQVNNLQIKNNDIPLKKPRIGTRRRFTQIYDTMHFELKRNTKKTIFLIIFFACIFVLLLIVQQLKEYAGEELPENPADYIISYLMMIGIQVIISSSIFAGSIIAYDYQKQTRNLLFPKIGKARLLIGRIIMLFLLNTICIIFYYGLISIMTFLKYSTIPISLFESMGWAIFYTFLIFSFVTFISSFMKSTSYTIITSILLLWMVFSIIESILIFTGAMEYTEPFFLVTYYENIITNCFNMPDPRYAAFIPVGPLSGFRNWITPSVQGAFIGMSVYSAFLLIFAYLFFRRRQK
ncbi:MAG: hypothetical protein ACTSPY_11420 [Candidatus Helarchaeota archaeon]